MSYRLLWFFALFADLCACSTVLYCLSLQPALGVKVCLAAAFSATVASLLRNWRLRPNKAIHTPDHRDLPVQGWSGAPLGGYHGNSQRPPPTTPKPPIKPPAQGPR